MSYYICTNSKCEQVLLEPETLYKTKNKNRIKCPTCGKYQDMKDLKKKMKDLGHDPKASAKSKKK